jgi:hypothetical protein
MKKYHLTILRNGKHETLFAEIISIATFLLIEKELRAGRSVELYIITSPRVNATINGFFGQEIMEISSFKEMENLCKSDYFKSEKRYPDWNFQENREAYPEAEAKLHNLYHENRLKK